MPMPVRGWFHNKFNRLYERQVLPGYEKLKNFKKILEKLRNLERMRRDLENKADLLFMPWGGTPEKGLFL
jgi:hypothetical protein